MEEDIVIRGKEEGGLILIRFWVFIWVFDLKGKLELLKRYIYFYNDAVFLEVFGYSNRISHCIYGYIHLCINAYLYISDQIYKILLNRKTPFLIMIYDIWLVLLLINLLYWSEVKWNEMKRSEWTENYYTSMVWQREGKRLYLPKAKKSFKRRFKYFYIQ